MIDYTGKINEHEKYLKVLKKLEDNTEYIEIVIIDGTETNNIVQAFAVKYNSARWIIFGVKSKNFTKYRDSVIIVVKGVQNDN